MVRYGDVMMNNKFITFMTTMSFLFSVTFIPFVSKAATIEQLRDYCSITEETAKTDGDYLALGVCLGYLMGMKDETAFWCYLKGTDMKKNKIVNLMARDSIGASVDAFRQSFTNWADKFPNTWSGETASLRRHMLGLGSAEAPFSDFMCD